MGAQSFFGILPHKLPYRTVELAVEDLPLPQVATLLWKHGTPDDLVVRPGHTVQTGQNLAAARRRPLVSTVTGDIAEITLARGPDGAYWTQVTLGNVRADQYAPLKAVADFSVLSPGRILTLLSQAGIAGLCPVAPSAEQPQQPGAQVDAIVISGFDSDLQTVVNPQVLRDDADMIEDGIRVLTHATGVKGVVLAVPEPLADLARAVPGAEAWVRPLPAIHPQGLPEMLARTVGAGWALQLDESRVLGNTLVMSLERLVSLAPSLVQGRPHVEKIVTCSVAGSGELRNLRVRIGTPIADLLAHLEIAAPSRGKVILGGPLRGDAAYSLEQPVTAWTDALIVQPPAELIHYDDSPCTNCGHCNAICPLDLQVNLLGRFAQYGFYEKCRDLVVDNCIECGLCAYVCPTRRPLVQYFRQAKAALRRGREEAVEQA